MMRRPAARVEEEAAEDPEKNSRQKLRDLDPRELLKLGAVVLEGATYYGKSSPVAGHFKEFRSEEGHTFVELVATGTKHEELLRVLSGRSDKALNIHVCPEGCSRQLTDERLVHAEEFEEVDLRRLPWLTNLQSVRVEEKETDEMAELRKEQARMMGEVQGKRKKENRKERKRKRREESEEGRERRSPKKDEEELEPGQKPLSWLFSDTGMDPNPKKRGKILEKARKIAKRGKKRKKKGKSSSGSASSSPSTSSSSSMGGDAEEGWFDDEMRLHSIWRKYPGALTAKSLHEIRRHLLTSAGTVWQLEKGVLPPLYTQYGRQVVIPSMGPSLQQETLTLCQSLDYLAMGKVAGAMDILNQRLKSVVALSKGAHWSLGRNYELVTMEDRGFAEEGEFLTAAKKAREDEKIKGLMARPSGGKGSDYSQGGKTRKGKEGKSAGKGQPTDGSKGKGGGSNREEAGKTPWSKK